MFDVQQKINLWVVECVFEDWECFIDLATWFLFVRFKLVVEKVGDAAAWGFLEYAWGGITSYSVINTLTVLCLFADCLYQSHNCCMYAHIRASVSRIY